jgi:cytoskeletal protein CcmA (bactofilin family)
LKGAKVTDAGKVKSWLAIRKDAYLAATGYVEPSLALRTDKAEILHPALDMTATVIATAPVFLVETSTKDQYRLNFLPATQISTGAAQVLMGQADISTGTSLRFSGKVASDGSVSLTAIALRLKKITVRGQITSIQAPDLHIQSSTGSIEIKIQPHTTVAQGSRSLQLSDLVAHDDVTVYGYSGRPGIIFARKLSVHRKLLGFTGSVESATSNSFELSAADGLHRVLLGPAVSFSGGSVDDITTGRNLHVTGYLRGDGSVIATRITFKKGKKGLMADCSKLMAQVS